MPYKDAMRVTLNLNPATDADLIAQINKRVGSTNDHLKRALRRGFALRDRVKPVSAPTPVEDERVQRLEAELAAYKQWTQEWFAYIEQRFSAAPPVDLPVMPQVESAERIDEERKRTRKKNMLTQEW